MEGDAEVVLETGGDGTVIARLGRYQVFGEMALLAKAPRTASAMAKVNCKALSLGPKDFNAALAQTLEFALMMMAVMAMWMMPADTYYYLLGFYYYYYYYHYYY